MIRITLTAGLLALSMSAFAQGASQPASAAKKALVAKVVTLQQPGVDNIAKQLVEQPAMQMMQQAGMALQQRVAPDRREAVARDIQADARKYAEELNPQVRDKAAKLAPTVLGPMLEERFTEDELKQLVAILESPTYRKYQGMGGEMLKSLGEKLVVEVKPLVEPRLRALNQSIGNRLTPAAGGAASAPAK